MAISNKNNLMMHVWKKVGQFNVYDTLCSQCKSSVSPKATWNSANSCNEWRKIIELETENETNLFLNLS